MKPEIVLRIGSWQELRDLATPVRFDVFVSEQGIDPEIEIDEADPRSLHCVALLGDSVVGTARLLPDGHIGRMAVRSLFRRHGIGGLMLECLVDSGFKRGHERIVLNAQAYVENFYLHHGFIRDGNRFILEGIEHVRMWRARPDQD